mmetsp:Transcript_127757/g.249050  ORF Transcript_127757/g.249050 Transcript_127757/m.249050 type:complete len:82 (+) Transcript_127757:231-476(+)
MRTKMHNKRHPIYVWQYPFVSARGASNQKSCASLYFRRRPRQAIGYTTGAASITANTRPIFLRLIDIRKCNTQGFTIDEEG